MRRLWTSGRLISLISSTLARLKTEKTGLLSRLNRYGRFVQRFPKFTERKDEGRYELDTVGSRVRNCDIIKAEGYRMESAKAKKRKHKRPLRNLAIFISVLTTAVLLSMALSGLHDDNNPFATPLFILAVALIARLTDG